jgi:hypothetical protein
MDVSGAGDVSGRILEACRHLEKTVAGMDITLTFDPVSVPDLEAVILAVKDAGDETALRGAAFMVGAYLGEILRSRLGGSWCASEDSSLALRSGDKELFPIARVYKFVENPSANSLDLYVRVLLQASQTP